MLQHFGYIVTYKKTWTTKQKALEIAFESWEESYIYLLIWMTTTQHFVPSTIVKYKTSNSMEDGDDDSSKVIINRVFWAFKPCIKGFQYYKPIVKVDDIFLTRKYYVTLLTISGQDGSQNLFLLAFVIIESESKEV